MIAALLCLSVAAIVVPYVGDSMDTRLSLMCECLTCGIEWGWQYDGLGVYDRLRVLAADHNRTVHTPAPAGVSAAPTSRDRPIGPAGAPIPTTSEPTCDTCHRLLSCVGTCPKGCPQ